MKPLTYDLSKVRTVLLVVPVSGTTSYGDFPLPTNDMISKSQGILSIEAFNTTMVTKSPTGATNAPDACYKTASLTIADSGGTTSRSQIPLGKLIRSSSGAPIRDLNIFREENGPNPMDPQKCFITIGDLSTLGAGTVMLVEVTYLKQ